jgi:hypothetical protein
MRNYIGGWSSTYDSCMAQRAIVGYAVLRGFEITAYNIRINFTSSSSASREHGPVRIVDQNLIDTQVRSLENVWGVVYIDGFGNGYALIQVRDCRWIDLHQPVFCFVLDACRCERGIQR